MNGCHFLGKLKSDPILNRSHNSFFVNFILEVEEYRRDKSGVKKRRTDLLKFQAWDSAAKTIEKHAQKDDIMVVESIARNGLSKDSESVVFRVTNFKILPKKGHN
jgi:single-stranded DNA-binding protein